MAQPADIGDIYVAARRGLLDALDALAEHRSAVILVGAQAVYLRAGDAQLDAAVAPYTQDADLALDTAHMGTDPRIVDAMTTAGFHLKVKALGGEEPGTWLTDIAIHGTTHVVPVDLLVPEAFAPANKGRRDARLDGHGALATRWTPGLEATIVDNTEMAIASLEPSLDDREIRIRVAGVPSLLIAKAHKLNQRVQDAAGGRELRLQPKDAGDILRLMRGGPSPDTVGTALGELALDPQVGPSVRDGIVALRRLFGTRAAPGIEQATTALAGGLPADTITQLATAYTTAMWRAYEAHDSEQELSS